MPPHCNACHRHTAYLPHRPTTEYQDGFTNLVTLAAPNHQISGISQALCSLSSTRWDGPWSKSAIWPLSRN